MTTTFAQLKTIETGMKAPEDLELETKRYTETQDDQRGNWELPHVFVDPHAANPTDNAALRFLLWRAETFITDHGVDVKTAMQDLAAHAYAEGGITGYDKGRTDCP